MLINDRQNTENDPWDFYPGVGDIASWGRLHRETWQAVQGLSYQLPGGELATNAAKWIDSNEKYAELANPGLGFVAAVNFGNASNSEIIMETIGSAKVGRQLANAIAEVLGAPDPMYGSESDEEEVDFIDSLSPDTYAKEVRLFVGGAALGLMAWGAYKLYQKGGL